MEPIDEFLDKFRNAQRDIRRWQIQMLTDTLILIIVSFAFGAFLGHLRVIEMLMRKVGIL